MQIHTPFPKVFLELYLRDLLLSLETVEYGTKVDHLFLCHHVQLISTHFKQTFILYSLTKRTLTNF